MNENRVNMRSGPSTSYSTLGSLKKGNVVKPISQSNGWIEINFNNTKGYIYSDYVVDTSENENVSQGGNSSSTSNVQLNYTLDQRVDVQYAKAQKGGNKIDASLSTGSAVSSGKYYAYKRGWSYNSPNHQYATDVNWANLISSVMTKITSMYSSSVMKYEIPKYK